jgi:hypothetical protein
MARDLHKNINTANPLSKYQSKKGKVVAAHMGRHRLGAEVSLHSFLTSMLDGNE